MPHQDSSGAGAGVLSRRRPTAWKLKHAAGPTIMLMALATLPSHAFAEEPDASSLQKEVEDLRREVQTLKEQVKSLQEAPPAPLAPQTQPVPKEAEAPAPAPQTQPTPPVAKEPPPISPQAQPERQAAPTAAPAAAKPSADSIVALRESWSQVNKGMTKTQITGLLGPPTTEMRIDGKLVWYYYYAGIGGSSVFFNGDGRVSSLQRPTVGWW
jgi:outer membrane biosynthesis protein TonB